jgi:hypothetical protein
LPVTKLILRDPVNPNLPGEVREFEHVGAIMGGQNSALLTFFNEDPSSDDGSSGPKPFYAVAASLVYAVETPEFNRAPEEPTRILAVPPGARIQ